MLLAIHIIGVVTNPSGFSDPAFGFDKSSRAIFPDIVILSMKERWDERYSQREFAYGELPNDYLKEQLARIPVGKILFPADGEGRNGVYAATLGWSVNAST